MSRRRLLVVLPYFNFAGFARRRELFLDFVRRYAGVADARLVVAEAALTHAPWDLPHPLPGADLHVRWRVADPLWLKEPLVNAAVRALPPAWRDDWDAVAWVDADLTFDHANWPTQALQALRQVDVLQLWSTAHHLDRHGQPFRTDTAFAVKAALAAGGIGPAVVVAPAPDWHPGFAWAMTRAAFDRLGGLLDVGALGSGDRHMAYALVGAARASAPSAIAPGYAAALDAWQARAAGLRLSALFGTVRHHWHGALADRKYRERWDVLTRLQYDPRVDVVPDPDAGGLPRLTAAAATRLRQPLLQYFLDRNEDA